jgi:hypothetical protein
MERKVAGAAPVTGGEVTMRPRTADISHMENQPCLCPVRDLMTVREVADLPVMRHVSAPTLYRLIERGEFPARKLSARKFLIVVTQWCPVHRAKARDDIDNWLERLAA